MIIKKLRMPIIMARKIEETNAKLMKQMADIDYIAMMSDIEIPTESEEGYVSED